MGWLLLALAGVGSPTPARAQQPVPISLPDTSGLAVGDTLQIPVQIEAEIPEGDEVVAFELTVAYDTTVVQFTGEYTTEGTFLENFGLISATEAPEGEISVSGAAAQGATGGPGPLIFLEAVVQGTGTSPLTFLNFQFNDGAIPTETTDGLLATVGAQPLATVSFEDGTLDDGMAVTVASLSIPEDGYVAIHDSTLLGPDGLPFTADDQPVSSVIGVSGYLEAGTYTDLDVTLFDVPGTDFPADTALSGAPTLIAMPHAEDSGNEQYDFVSSGGQDDLPFLDADGNPVISTTVLPVEVTAFHAQVQGRRVRLTWATLSEQNNAGFYVEYQRAGQHAWTPANEQLIDGAGTSTRGRSYRFRTEALRPGRYAFRLKQVDYGSTPTVVHGAQAEVSIETAGRYALSPAYPNPFRAQTQFQLDVSEAQKVTVRLYNALGQQVEAIYSGPVRPGQGHVITVDAEGLASGVYFCQVEGEHFATSQRVVLVK